MGHDFFCFLSVKKIHQQRLVFWTIGTLCLSLLFGIIISWGVFTSWQLKANDFLFTGKQNITSKDIILIAIDDKSLEIKNTSEINTLTFDKADYAKLIENLENAGAKTIGIDIIFTEKSSEEDQSVLVETLKKYDNIILAAEPNGLKPLSPFIDARPENIAAIRFIPDEDNTVRRQYVTFEDTIASDSFGVHILKNYLGVLPGESTKKEDQYELTTYTARVGKKKYNPITIPIDKQESFLINFFGPPNSFQSVSFVDAFEGKFIDRKTGKEINMNNKIVLIGEMGTGIHDEQYVPISFGKAMPGVEIHANTIQTILNQRFLTEQSSEQKIIMTLLTIAIALGLFLTLSISLSVGLLILSMIIYFILSIIFFEYGIIIDMVHIYFALIFSFTSAYLFRYFREQKYAHEMRGAFSKYVSKELVEEIFEKSDELSLGGEKKNLTVFFSDIANFTSISEKVPPEKLVKYLNRYFDEMSEIIFSTNGTLDKFIGDAIMAFWGAPIQQKNHAENACLAALKHREKRKELAKEWEKERIPVFNARIGINTGDMIVGNIGSQKRFDYTVIGDEVNLASRLEGVNKHYETEILITENTYNAAKKVIEAREIDLITIKGKKKPVKIFELLRKKGELLEEEKKWKTEFEKGLNEYRKQNWKKAKEYFNKAKKIKTDDPVIKVYLDRCNLLPEKKLSKNWDGVHIFDTK